MERGWRRAVKSKGGCDPVETEPRCCRQALTQGYRRWSYCNFQFAEQKRRQLSGEWDLRGQSWRRSLCDYVHWRRAHGREAYCCSMAPEEVGWDIVSSVNSSDLRVRKFRLGTWVVRSLRPLISPDNRNQNTFEIISTWGLRCFHQIIICFFFLKS